MTQIITVIATQLAKQHSENHLPPNLESLRGEFTINVGPGQGGRDRDKLWAGHSGCRAVIDKMSYLIVATIAMAQFIYHWERHENTIDL
jgi:hypothetical protein